MSIHRSPILVEDAWGQFCDKQKAAWICAPELRRHLNIPKGARIRIVASTKKTPDTFRAHRHSHAAWWDIDEGGYLLWCRIEVWLSSLPTDTLWCWVEIEP